MRDEYTCSHFSRYLTGIEEMYALMYFICRECIIDVRDLYDILSITPAKLGEAEVLRAWLTLREKFYPLTYFHTGNALEGDLYEKLMKMPEKYQKRMCDILTDYFRDRSPRAHFGQLHINEVVDILCEYEVCIRDILCLGRLLPHDFIKIYRSFCNLDISKAGYGYHQTKQMLKFVTQKKVS
jgi:hypothetical protein